MSKTSKISLNQERYLIAEQYSTTNFTLPISYKIKGYLDSDKLVQCFQSVVDNNDALRIQFRKNLNGDITQEVMLSNKIEFNRHSLNNPSYDELEDVIRRYFYVKNNIFNSFPARFQLIKINENEHILTISSHHSLMDGLSITVLMMQLAKVWNQNRVVSSANSNYIEVLSENGLLGISNSKLSPLKDYWKSYLAEANPAVMPIDYLSTDANQDYKACAKRLISSEMTIQIENFAKIYNLSAYHLFYLAYNILIAKHSGSTDVVTSFESAGRQNLKNASRTIGLFSLALILRVKINDEATIHQLLLDIKNDTERGIEHQHYPYHFIIKDAKINPKYSFNWFPKMLLPKLQGLEISQESFLNLQSSFDFNLHCHRKEHGISLEPLFNPTIFSQARVEKLLEQFESVIKQIIAKPEASIADINLITETNQKYKPNFDISFAKKVKKKINEDFLNCVKSQPQNIAINYLDQLWTYREIDDISDKLAQLLISKGLASGDKVAILGLRCPSMITAILATIRCGASFTVLNAAYPVAMLKNYWNTLNPDFLITCDYDLLTNEFDCSNQLGSKLIALGQVLNANDALLTSFNYKNIQDSAINPNSVAYHLFTSGTTDEPKCIATSHSPLVHFVHWQIENFKINAGDKFTLLSGVSHDPILRDIFTALSSGATILIPTEETIFNPETLYDWLIVTQPTICHTTPAMCKLMHNGSSNKNTLNSIRAIFFGGDRLESHHVKDMTEMAPNAAIINFYGASETPQAMAYHEVSPLSLNEVIPIGKAIANTQILLLNNKLEPIGAYEIGQIAIRTKYLSDGYITNTKSEQLIENKAYLKDIFSIDPEIRIYLTGDNGYSRTDGNVVFLGRFDDQIKIRGFRIDLNVINSNITAMLSIDDAFTLAIEDGNASALKKRLVSYVIKKTNADISIEDIRRKLSEKLPSYMLPSKYIFISHLPLLPNGKVDRKKLIDINTENDSSSKARHISGRNEKENNLIYAWAKILNLDPKSISPKDSFTTLDGDSLSFIQASLVLEKEIGKTPDSWQSLSIEKLAEINYQEHNHVDIHTEVLFRTISIVLVVIGHFWIADFNGQVESLFINATSALFLIAGFTFANFPMESVQFKNNISPILKTIARTAAPTFLVTLIHVIYRSDYSISKLLFFDNFHWGHSPYWFIELLLQTLLLLAIIFSFKKIRHYAVNSPYNFGLVLMGVGALAGILIPYVWNPTHLNPLQLPHMKSWLFFLGWTIFYIKNNQQKLTISILGIVLPIIVFGQVSALTSICTILLIYLPKFNLHKTKLTSLVQVSIYAIASASLYIYITHVQIRSVLRAVGLDGSVLINIIAAILGGVLVHYIWHSVIGSMSTKILPIIKTKIKLIGARLGFSS